MPTNSVRNKTYKSTSENMATMLILEVITDNFKIDKNL
jgi:hypothetical protein